MMPRRVSEITFCSRIMALHACNGVYGYLPRIAETTRDVVAVYNLIRCHLQLQAAMAYARGGNNR
jgi:hypothetical protein